MKIQLSVLVVNKVSITIISFNVACSRHDIAEKSSFGDKQLSLTH
jgi:hypothetical protein